MWNMILTKLFRNFIKIQRPQVYKHWRTSLISSRTNSTTTDVIDVDLFSLEDKDKILNIINYKRTEDLLQYSITKKRAQSLELYRENNGPFKSLEDLLQVQGMNNKCLYRFYKSIICGKRRMFPKIIKRGLVITPKDSGDSQEEVKTVLGIHIGQDMISWSLLNRDCQVLEWSYKAFPKDRKKENIHSLLQIILPIAIKLPKADRYIMQEIGGDIGYQQSQKFYHVYVEQSMIVSIILSCLTMSHSKLGSTEFVANNIFILRQHILRKVYGLIVGNEVISTQYMLQKLLQESDGLTESKERLPNVLLNAELKEMYKAHSPMNQEQMSWSLLIALAFVELVVHKRTDMIVRSTA